MNEWDQRLAIAEAVGWKPSDGDIQASKAWEEITGQHTDPGPPDYLHDLNAMAEAETTLLNRAGTAAGYFNSLCNMLRQDARSLHNQQWLPVIRATAAQRAEAFLRTIGKWQDHRPANASSCDSQPPAPS